MAMASSSGKFYVTVRIELLQVDILVGQSVEPDRTEKRLDRLHQQNRLGETAVVEAAAEMDAALDRDRLEFRDVANQVVERQWFLDLHEVAAEDQHVAAAELDHDPELAMALDRLHDRALDAHRLASRFVGETAHVVVECIACLHALGLERVAQPGV